MQDNFYTLYGFAPSGNTHKVRMLMHLLGLPFNEIPINLKEKAHKTASFLAINPKGQVPALQTPDGLLGDSHAILIYLARKHGADRWWPDNAKQLADIMGWFSFSANEIHNGLASLRKHRRLDVPIPLSHCEAVAHSSLSLLEAHLTQQDWLAGDALSLADICCVPYVALAHEAGIELGDYPMTQAWVRRCRTTLGVVWMNGMLAD